MWFWIIAATVVVAVAAIGWVTSGPRFSRVGARADNRFTSPAEQQAVLEAQARVSSANAQGGYFI